MQRTRYGNHVKNPGMGNEIASAGFTHTENGIDSNNGIFKTTEWNANTMLPAQGNGINRPFYKKHTTRIALKFDDWFRKMANDKFCPRGGATADTRFSELFKFCYCIEKNGELFFGDVSTETMKMRVEALRDENGKKVLVPILKLV